MTEPRISTSQTEPGSRYTKIIFLEKLDSSRSDLCAKHSLKWPSPLLVSQCWGALSFWCESGSRFSFNLPAGTLFSVLKIEFFAKIYFASIISVRSTLLWEREGSGSVSVTNGSGQGFGSVSGSAWIRINLSCWIRIRIQIGDPDPDPGGQKWPTKIETSTEFSCFEVLDVHFWGLKASPVTWASFMGALGKVNCSFWSKKKINFFSAVIFFKFRSSNPGSGSGIRIRNPDPQLEKMLDPDPYPDPH